MCRAQQSRRLVQYRGSLGRGGMGNLVSHLDVGWVSMNLGRITWQKVSKTQNTRSQDTTRSNGCIRRLMVNWQSFYTRCPSWHKPEGVCLPRSNQGLWLWHLQYIISSKYSEKLDKSLYILDKTEDWRTLTELSVCEQFTLQVKCKFKALSCKKRSHMCTWSRKAVMFSEAKWKTVRQISGAMGCISGYWQGLSTLKGMQGVSATCAPTRAVSLSGKALHIQDKAAILTCSLLF